MTLPNIIRTMIISAVIHIALAAIMAAPILSPDEVFLQLK